MRDYRKWLQVIVLIVLVIAAVLLFRARGCSGET